MIRDAVHGQALFTCLLLVYRLQPLVLLVLLNCPPAFTLQRIPGRAVGLLSGDRDAQLNELLKWTPWNSRHFRPVGRTRPPAGTQT